MQIAIKFDLHDADAQNFESMRVEFNEENNIDVRSSAFARKMLLDAIASHDFQPSLTGE